MYGVNDLRKFSSLGNKQLIQICVGNYNIILNFEGDISITIECVFQLILDGKIISSTKLPVSAALLFRLLGEKVKSVDIPDVRTLEIVFSNNNILRLCDSNKEFESFQISGPSINVIV